MLSVFFLDEPPKNSGKRQGACQPPDVLPEGGAELRLLQRLHDPQPLLPAEEVEAAQGLGGLHRPQLREVHHVHRRLPRRGLGAGSTALDGMPQERSPPKNWIRGLFFGCVA